MLIYKFCNPEKTFVHNIPTLTELMLQIYVDLAYSGQGIAYPLKAKPGMQQGVVFFTRMRSLRASGFYTSKIGIKDIGYLGNAPGIGKAKINMFRSV